ncbi:hypothetical protein [Aquabacterium sp.]|uniref:hypothetical protein n=1 Tax=Aquabacterium sp. TaxID=1872578 RepID=UPI002CC02EBC|nr:hypothetical protein [Aquabacterium sp.]HSW05569.1 hypothetical protein [Aquabacterium sp.]
MNRLSTLVTLIALAGIGWACAFAVIGLALFARVPDNGPLAVVFGAFGFVAGAACTVLRLAFEQQLPRELVAGLRRPAQASEAADAAPGARASVFGA